MKKVQVARVQWCPVNAIAGVGVAAIPTGASSVAATRSPRILLFMFPPSLDAAESYRYWHDPRDTGILRSAMRSVRGMLYTLARLMGDVTAVKKGKIGQRVVRRAVGKAAGKWLR